MPIAKELMIGPHSRGQPVGVLTLTGLSTLSGLKNDIWKKLTCRRAQLPTASDEKPMIFQMIILRKNLFKVYQTWQVLKTWQV